MRKKGLGTTINSSGPDGAKPAACKSLVISGIKAPVGGVACVNSSGPDEAQPAACKSPVISGIKAP